MDKLKITDLLDVNIMQQMQDCFSEFTNMAALMADENGVPVTRPSHFTRFCNELVRKSPLGCERCKACDKEGAVFTMRSGRASAYNCHAGLVDYAAPIVVEGRFIGSFIGGQVRVVALDKDKLWEDALELGIAPEQYIAAAQEIPLLPREQVDAAAQFLFELARILSEMAYGNYKLLEESRRQAQIARSQTSFIMKVSNDLMDKISGWIGSAETVGEAAGQAGHMAEAIRCEGREVLSEIESTLEYIRISEGKMELSESRYHIREMLGELTAGVRELIGDKPVCLNLTVADDVPVCVMGDSGHLGQVLFKLMQNSVLYSESGNIDVTVSAAKVSYATWLTFVIKDQGKGMQQGVLKELQRCFSKRMMTEYDEEETTEMGLSMVGRLVHQMYGAITVESVLGEGTTFEIHIPQLGLDGEEQ